MWNETLKKAFIKLCKQEENAQELIFSKVSENTYEAVWSMYLRMIRIDIVYSWRWLDLAPPSVLYCRVYLSKNEPVYLHLPVLLGYLKVEDYRACVFPCIESEARMKCCFDALMAVVRDYIPKMEKAAGSEQGSQIMRQYAVYGFAPSAKMLSKPEPEQEPDTEELVWIQGIQESINVSRLSDFKPYQEFLKGNWQKSLKLYKKLENRGLSEYEKGLCWFMEDPANRGFRPISRECYTLQSFKKSTGQLADLKGMLLVYAVAAVFFCGLIQILRTVQAWGTVYYLGVGWWFGLIMAGLPAIFGYGAWQDKIQGVMAREQPWVKEFYRFGMTKSKFNRGLFKLVKWLVAVILLAEIGFCCWLGVNGDCFYDTYAVTSSLRQRPQERVRFEYEDVVAIYHLNGRYNEFGDRLERQSYVICLEDGTWLDLDCSCSLKKQREIATELFPDLPITELDSDRDLP